MQMLVYTKLQEIREQDPLKQGLKLGFNTVFMVNFGIREQDPLKQGLKHKRRTGRNQPRKIREQDPLKQGLKHLKLFYLDRRPYSRARSIKTRIETVVCVDDCSCTCVISRIREQDPLKQGLKH